MMQKENGVQDYCLNASVYRQYAYFRVRSQSPLDGLGDKLDMQPIRTWNKGDLVERNGHSHRRNFSCWNLESGLHETDPLENHVEALMDRLEPIGDRFREIVEQYECKVVCVSYNLQSFGWVLTSALQRRLVNQNLDLEFEMYGVVDPHDEIQELRSIVSERRPATR